MLIQLSASTKTKLKTVFFISLAGIIAGIIYANFVFGFGLDKIVKGAFIGFLITGISSYVEIFIFSDSFKNSKFIKIIIYRSLFYLFLISLTITGVLITYKYFINGELLSDILSKRVVLEFLEKDFVQIFLFSIVASFLINFIRQINMMLGWGTVMSVMFGKYKSPVSDYRIFMFIDLKSSTRLGEKLGAKKYSSLLQDFFSAVSNPVTETGGYIYQYVGDEVVVTWRVDKEGGNDMPITCFFMIQDALKKKEDYYIEEYGVVPDFKAGIHAGVAIVTEVGDLQKEIVYHGDVLNTASRIQSECNKMNQKILFSKEYLRSTELSSSDYNIKSMGYFKLRGKSRKTELYTIAKKESVNQEEK